MTNETIKALQASVKALQANHETLSLRITTLEGKLHILAQATLTADDYQAFLRTCESIANNLAADREKVRQMLPDLPPGEDGAPEH